MNEKRIPVLQSASSTLSESYEKILGLKRTKKNDAIANPTPKSNAIVFLK